MYDIAVIGAGIIGTFIARELSRYKLKTALIEKNNDVACGTTKANSAIVHCGYDAKPDTLKAKLNVSGNPMFDTICEQMDVPFKRIGSLVLAFSNEEIDTLKELYNRGIQNGLTNITILDQEQIRSMEPNLSSEALAALYAPDSGIVGPFELAIALAENAVENGVELMLNTELKDITIHKGIFKLHTNTKSIEAKYVINCTGNHADNINDMVSREKFRITPRRGQYFVLDKSAGSLVNRIVFQCPTNMGKGVLVLPTVHGNILVGPDSEDIDDKLNFETTMERMEYIKDTARKSIKDIPFDRSITAFTGLRATCDKGDFVISEAKDVKGFINVAGIESPGLSASPAIAQYVIELLRGISVQLTEKDDFNPYRRKLLRFSELSEAEKSEAIKKDPSYGRIICRCELITEGEIVDAIKRKAGAATLDGVKRRVRPGMGRCQGGFCSPRVMEILARELDKDIMDIVKDTGDSKILTGITKVNNVAEV